MSADVPPEGVYRVWHADRPRGPGEPELDFPVAYTRVAEVRASGPAEAARLTTHIDKPWQENPGVSGEDGARSTALGDVIVDPEGRAHRVGASGFERVVSDYDRHLEAMAARGRDGDRGGPTR